MVDRWWYWFLWVAAVLCVLAIIYAALTPTPGADRYAVPEKYAEHLKTLERQAIEKAFIQQVTHLFGQWMKDSTDQPQRALNGIDQAKRAYVDSMTAIDRR
jgi:hypothetical protein